MSERIRSMVREVKTTLETLYGERLKGVYLFGSYARGEEDEESDVDILIILDRINHYAGEVDRTGELISTLSLKHGVSISQVFIPHDAWVLGATIFLANVREEAVAA